jgi:Protein of unknown function (DUF664)
VEVGWFQFVFAGQEAVIPCEEIEPTDSVASAVIAYQAATRVSTQIVNESKDLDQLCDRTATTPEPMSLRWVLVYMVEETARHAGHADILREQIDGQTGR